MLFFDRRERKERRLRKDRRKVERSEHKGKENRKAKDRRDTKERREPKDRRSNAYHRLQEDKRKTVNDLIESLYHKDVIKVPEKRQKERYFCKASEYVHINVAIRDEGGKILTFDLRVNDCSMGGIGILVTQKNKYFRKNLNIGDMLQNVAFFSPWVATYLNGTVIHKTKIEKNNHPDCHIIGLKTEDPLENYRPDIHFS